MSGSFNVYVPVAKCSIRPFETNVNEVENMATLVPLGEIDSSIKQSGVMLYVPVAQWIEQLPSKQ